MDVKKFLKFIPDNLKRHFVRSLLSTKHVTKNSSLETRLATTFEDYKKAFSLLHDCYVSKGLMEPHPSGMRCSVHSFLPHNRVIVVFDKQSNEVVGTVSLILDNTMGLPADNVYHDEVNSVRMNRKGKMVEVSALAIDKRFRKQSHVIQFMLNKYLYIYCRDFMHVKMLSIVIHPKAELFYSALMEFKPLGKVIEYNFVKGALARFMFMDFSGNFEQRLGETYRNRKNSFYDYVINQHDKRLIFEKESEDEVVKRNVGIMLALIHASSFDVNKLSKFEQGQLLTGLNLTKEYFNLDEVISDYRFDVNLSAVITSNHLSEIKKLTNISRQGAFVESTLENIAVGQVGAIQFQWKGELFKAAYKIAWINQSTCPKLPSGFGIQFTDTSINLFPEDEKLTA